MPQQVGDNQAQHAVAEEFEALVIARRRPPLHPAAASLRFAQNARVSQRLCEKLGPGELMTDQLCRIL
jgi:hypothetical protein